MVDTRVRIKISKDNESIFETVTEKSKGLKELISTLKETQQKVNEFLTTLVDGQENDLTKDEFDDLESGSDEDSTVDRNGVNPKKYETCLHSRIKTNSAMS